MPEEVTQLFDNLIEALLCKPEKLWLYGMIVWAAAIASVGVKRDIFPIAA